MASTTLEKLRRVRVPVDYFAGTQSSLRLWPEKILCFTRSSQPATVSEPLAKHHHHRYVLIIPWLESGEVHVDSRRFLLKPPHALLIFPFQFHHGFNFKKTGMLWQFVTFEMREGAALEALRLDPLRKLAAEDFGLLSELVTAWNEAKRRDELADWLALVLKRMVQAPSPTKGSSLIRSKPASSLLLRINQHCLLHLHQVLGIKELAAHLSISESHLRASFRRETGMSLGQHMRRLRLQKAIGLLLQSDLSITQVAERCGFDSIFAFSRSFRHFTGVSARDYRGRLADRSGRRAAGNRKG